MNYRHAFHAGNFADVVKHVVLARIILHLCKKDAAFRVIDTHAGAARYNLASDEARRGGEWQDGIGRVFATSLAGPAADLLSPYLDAVRSFNSGAALTVYPGSPLLIQRWLRRQDRLVACELEPSAAKALMRNLRGDARIKSIAIDGWQALSAYLPPVERRGLVLIDPPFEAPDEYRRLADALAAAWRKWPSGFFMAWYPVKDVRELAAFWRAISSSGLENLLRVELNLAPSQPGKLRGTGLLIVNPPWTLPSELKVMLPALAAILDPGGTGQVTIAPFMPKLASKTR